MLAMCAMLMTSTVFQYNERWYHSLPIPAQCVFTYEYGLSEILGIGLLALTLFLLLSGYVSAIASMFSTSFVPGFVEKRYVKFWHRMNKRYLKLRNIPWIDLSSGDKVKETCLRILLADNIFIGFLFDLSWFAYGIWNLLSDRSRGAGLLDDSSTNTQSWGFGQLVPVFLLLLPVMTVLEIF